VCIAFRVACIHSPLRLSHPSSPWCSQFNKLPLTATPKSRLLVSLGTFCQVGSHRVEYQQCMCYLCLMQQPTANLCWWVIRTLHRWLGMSVPCLRSRNEHWVSKDFTSPAGSSEVPVVYGLKLTTLLEINFTAADFHWWPSDLKILILIFISSTMTAS
jgi:hypothetical protein